MENQHWSPVVDGTLDAADLLGWCRGCRDLVDQPDRTTDPLSAYGASMLHSTLEWLANPRTWRPIGERDTGQRLVFQQAVCRRRRLGMPATPDDVITVATAIANFALSKAKYDPVVEKGIRWGMRSHARQLRQRARICPETSDPSVIECARTQDWR